jgi:DNA-binding beta-propeller fold protein YncE
MSDAGENQHMQNRMAHAWQLVGGAMLLAGCCLAQAPAWVKPPTVTHDAAAQAWQVSFEVSRPTDVEVAVLDATGAVARHLAAGVLGAKDAPPAPLQSGLAQSIAWDGKDDFGNPVSGSRNPESGTRAPFSIRVRAGMRPALDQIVGGDPYAFYSREMGQGDHAAWRVTGLEAKADGSVYVMANANNYGPPTIRKFDAAGNYRSTVFPPPAGKPVEAMRGWGLNIRADGTYAPRYNDLSSPALSTTIISGTRGWIASLVPSPQKDRLLLLAPDLRALLTVNTDGTIPPDAPAEGMLVADPPLVKKGGPEITGSMQIALSPDGRVFYLGGLFAGSGDGRNRTGAETTGAWRDGQVYQVDVATRRASVFFALPEKEVIADLDARGKSSIADFKYGPCAALQGVAADAEGHVFVCDRQNRRVLVLDKDGKVMKEVACDYPDAIAVHPRTRTLYVTTRTGHYHGGGKLKLLRLDDWSRDAAFSQTLALCDVKDYSQPTRLAVAVSGGEVFLWVAYTALPVHVYRDKGSGLELARDFYAAGTQRALDLQHIVVDPKTEELYVADGWANVFRIRDWKNPQFARCLQDDTTPLRALSLGIDWRNRRLYAHGDRTPVTRHRMDGAVFPPDPAGDSHVLTPKISNDWRIGLGFGDRGLAAAPDGSVAKLGVEGTGPDYSGPILFFRADAAKSPWTSLVFSNFGKARSGGIRFDLRGNLYVAKSEGKTANPPKGFEKDGLFLESLGRIYKYVPTGTMGNLFPSEPTAPVKVYDVNYGAIGNQFSRAACFGVDGYGRIYYPTSLEPRVSVIDNQGNPVVSFGTYGNRDSLGGLPGDLVPTPDIPMAWPNSVDATEDFIYVSDIVNVRILRLAKKFGLDAVVKLPN